MAVAPQIGMPSPEAANDIDAAALTRLVQDRHPGAEALSVQLMSTDAGTATKLRLAVKWNALGEAQGLPPAVIVKGGLGPHAEAMELIYRHEVRFFNDIQPRLGLNAPRAFGAVSDDESRRHLIVMEDLDRRGVRFGRVLDPITPEAAKGFLDILARLHARTWTSTGDSPDFSPGGIFDGIVHWDALPDEPWGTYAWGQLEPETWHRFMALPRAQAIPQRFHDRDWMQRALLQLNVLGRSKPWCLLHGDFHLGNLYHDADGAPGVLDWQTYARGHWSHDVTYFIVSALDIADRRDHDRALVAYYLDRLSREGVENPPELDAAMQAFRLQLIDGLFYWTVNPPEWQAEVNNCAVAPRFAMAALDHGTWEMID